MYTSVEFKILIIELIKHYNNHNINQVSLSLCNCLSAYMDTLFSFICFWLLRSCLRTCHNSLAGVAWLFLLFSSQGHSETWGRDGPVLESLSQLFLVGAFYALQPYLLSRAVCQIQYLLFSPEIRIPRSYNLHIYTVLKTNNNAPLVI